MNASPMKQSTFKKRLARRIVKGLAVVAMLGVLLAGGLVGSLWLEHRTHVTLPAPTGPFAVGRALYDWVDNDTLDALAPVPGTKRELLVWIWYPAAVQSDAVVDDYLPAQARAPAGRVSGALIFGLLTWQP